MPKLFILKLKLICFILRLVFILKLKLIWFIVKLDYWTYLKTYLNQRQKGFIKYGKYIENCKNTDYDWEQMATEELVDAIEYIKMIDKF